MLRPCRTLQWMGFLYPMKNYQLICRHRKPSMYIRNQNGVSRKRGLNDVHCKQDRTKQGISEKTATFTNFWSTYDLRSFITMSAMSSEASGSVIRSSIWILRIPNINYKHRFKQLMITHTISSFTKINHSRQALSFCKKYFFFCSSEKRVWVICSWYSSSVERGKRWVLCAGTLNGNSLSLIMITSHLKTNFMICWPIVTFIVPR